MKWTLLGWLDALLHKMRLRVPAVCDRYDAHVLGMSWDMFRDWNNPNSPYFVVQDTNSGEWQRIGRTWTSSTQFTFNIEEPTA